MRPAQSPLHLFQKALAAACRPQGLQEALVRADGPPRGPSDSAAVVDIAAPSALLTLVSRSELACRSTRPARLLVLRALGEEGREPRARPGERGVSSSAAHPASPSAGGCQSGMCSRGSIVCGVSEVSAEWLRCCSMSGRSSCRCLLNKGEAKHGLWECRKSWRGAAALGRGRGRLSTPQQLPAGFRSLC